MGVIRVISSHIGPMYIGIPSSSSEIKSEEKNVGLAWVDYKKAYDVVLQTWIIECMKILKISEKVIIFISKVRKCSFSQAAVTCTTWTLTKRMEKKLDVNYTRMLRAILNKSWGKTAAIRLPTTHHENHPS